MTPVMQTSDIEQARRYFCQTRQRVVESTRSLSEPQWKFKPAPDRWSIAEILEHMTIVHERVLGRVHAELAEAPASPAERDVRRVDAIIFEKIPDRSVRAKAPEVIQPTGTLTLAETLGRVFQNYERLTNLVESTPGLRDHILESPPLRVVTQGEVTACDGYQWALTAAAHDERHVRQIEEVKADPNFPAA